MKAENNATVSSSPQCFTDSTKSAVPAHLESTSGLSHSSTHSYPKARSLPAQDICGMSDFQGGNTLERWTERNNRLVHVAPVEVALDTLQDSEESAHR